MKRVRGWMFVMALGSAVALSWATNATRARAGTEASGDSAASAVGDSVIAAEKLYKKHCKSCHGADGHGDGPRAMFLSPKPRNFAEPVEFRSKNDDELVRVISEGGGPNGLSAAMPAWGRKLLPGEIKGLLGFIRGVPARDSLAKANREANRRKKS